MLLPLDLPPGRIASINLVWQVKPLGAAKDNM
jgi:hypothetical protein